MSTTTSRPRAPSGAGDYASESADSKSPLSGFLKSLTTTTQKQTKDGQTPKRRGPKPDSKPALTRRQELNRQAQRTHRERKEMYIKALEQEVLRLKELYANSTRDRDTVIVENQKLKELLAAHGVPFDTHGNGFHSASAHSFNGSSSGSISGSYLPDTNTSGFSPPPLRSQDSSMTSHTPRGQHGMVASGRMGNNRLDYDQIGIDFVLTLERPCMEHMQYLVVRSHNPEGKPFNHPLERLDDTEHEHMCGHALMATCPPASHIVHKPNEPYPHQMPDLKTPDLMRLLALSAQLPIELEGEITPVMAWAMVLQNSRVHEMDGQDFELIKADLTGKVRCYGFGAVLEEFEVRDALSNLFAQKEGITNGHGFAAQQVSVYG